MGDRHFSSHSVGFSARPNYIVGQRWSYKTRPEDPDSTIVIGAVQTDPPTIHICADLEKFAAESEAAQRYIEGKEIRKVIVVPNKLVNFVIAK